MSLVSVLLGTVRDEASRRRQVLLDTSTGKGLSVEDVARLATWRGLAYGVRIAFRCRNSMHLVAAVLKLANGGGAAVLQNPRDLSEDAVRQLTVCGVVTVVLDEDDSANRDFAIRHGLRVISLSCLLSEDGEETCRSGAAGAAAAECLVIFSSGTTGLPKGVRLSVDNVTSHMRLRLAVRQPLGSVLHVMPMFHIYGLVICFQALMTATPLYFLPPPYSVDRLMDVLEQFKIEEAPLVTPIIRDLAQRSDLHRIAHSVKRIHNGGAALDHETIVRLRSLMPHTQQTQGYGMSETSGGFVYTDTTRPIRDDSIGHVLPETQIRIADDGELFVRGPTVFVGYLPATVDCGVDKEGWLATGDQVKQDSDGYLYIVGRKKEVFKVKGEQVSPTELEGTILRLCPELDDAAVVGVPHPRSGAVPVAHVLLKPGAQLSERQLIERMHVPSFKRPHAVVFRQQPIPKTASGKIQRSKL